MLNAYLKRQSLSPRYILNSTPASYPWVSQSKKDVLESLSEQIIERGYRHVGTEFLFKCSPKVEFHHTFTVTDVFNCNHISCINFDRIWVSGIIWSLYQIDQVKNTLSKLNFVPLLSGYHTVNMYDKLIYIGNDYTLTKLQKKTKQFSYVELINNPQSGYLDVSTHHQLLRIY